MWDKVSNSQFEGKDLKINLLIGFSYNNDINTKLREIPNPQSFFFFFNSNPKSPIFGQGFHLMLNGSCFYTTNSSFQIHWFQKSTQFHLIIRYYYIWSDNRMPITKNEQKGDHFPALVRDVLQWVLQLQS